MFIAIWIISAIACYNIADNKGYKKRKGFFAGIIFGVFALIYYATLKKKQ